LQSYTERRYL